MVEWPNGIRKLTFKLLFTYSDISMTPGSFIFIGFREDLKVEWEVNSETKFLLIRS